MPNEASNPAVHVDIDGRGFIRVRVTGPLTDEVLLECSRRTRATAEFEYGAPTMLDLADVTDVNISCERVVALGQWARDDRNYLAIVAPTPYVFGMARMYQLTAEEVAGRRVQVFRDQAAAIDWLTKRWRAET